MGAAGSVEEGGGPGGPSGQPPPHPGSARHRPPSTAGSSRGSGGNTPTYGSRPGSHPSSRRGSLSSGHTWKNAFKGSGLQNPTLRKQRAAALGRKSAVTVNIDKTGFSLQHIRICEGQMISWEWYDGENQGYNVTQVVHDGDQYRPVPGGFNSGPVVRQGFFDQQFNLAGEYKFVSAGIRCTPLTVEVFPRKEVEAELNDQGFAPKIIRVDEGSSVMWRWTGCGIPHTVSEVRYNHKRGAMVQREQAERQIPTKAGSFKRDFPKPGIFYFQTEGSMTGSLHTCIVHVRERQREVRIEVFDRSFSPPILVIEEGDRIWWSWSKDKCKKTHCIYQIEPPSLQHPQDESYKPVKNGFKWPQPSKSALMSCEFYEQGVYYYSDHSFDEAAEYIGTIIVKPKTKDHFIEISAEGFSPDLLYADVADRIWWTWKCEDATIPKFSLREVDKTLSPLASRVAIEEENSGEGSYMDDALENMKVQVGLDTIQLGSIGVYTYCLADPDQRSIASCSIISSAGSRNHTVHVTDNGFEPKVVTVHPNDRVWWVWQDSRQQHNIIQVSHQGNHIKNGFCSGAPSDAPSAFMSQFLSPGVYYYISTNLAKSFGAVVVSSQPKVHEVQVATAAIAPDPVILSVNDVVAWTFKGLRNHDVHLLNGIEELADAQVNSRPIQHARRTLSKLFTEKGIYHFTSRAFLKSTKGEHRTDKSRLSTLLVDDPSDSMVVRVNSQGFHPKSVNITKGQSVLWTWKEAGDEAHNIIHVNSPDSDAPLSVIQGGQSFNSGRPVARNSFLYTFDEPGSYCVASQGGPGFAGVVNVLDHSVKASTPYVRGNSPSGEVAKNSVIHLTCDSAHAQIYYTLDGSAPDQSRLIPKNHNGLWNAMRGKSELYKADKGIVLRQSGLMVIRAIAVADNTLNSLVMTSNRFVVLPGEDDNQSVSSEEPEQAQDNTASWQWWQCVPVIKGVFTGSGIMELFWDPPSPESMPYIKGYQVFLNGVTYCPAFPAQHNSVNIAGLAGGRMYEIMLEVYPTNSMFLPHKSNKLTMKCPKTTSTGGALISLEQTEKPDTLTIVWMAISTSECPIKGYRVYLNGQMCGSQVVPDAKSDRCKVVIEGCELEKVYQVIVAAIPSDGSTPKMSNELQISLPLELDNIRIPPAELRMPDDDLYREYIEVSEGASYVDDTAGPASQTEPITFDLTQQPLGSTIEPDIPVSSLLLGKHTQSRNVRNVTTTDKWTQYDELHIKDLSDNGKSDAIPASPNSDKGLNMLGRQEVVEEEEVTDKSEPEIADSSSDIDDMEVEKYIEELLEKLLKSVIAETRQVEGAETKQVEENALLIQSSSDHSKIVSQTSIIKSTISDSDEEPELNFGRSNTNDRNLLQDEVPREGSRNPNLSTPSEPARQDSLLIEDFALKDEGKAEDEGFDGDKDDESMHDVESVNESLDPSEAQSKFIRDSVDSTKEKVKPMSLALSSSQENPCCTNSKLQTVNTVRTSNSVDSDKGLPPIAPRLEKTLGDNSEVNLVQPSLIGEDCDSAVFTSPSEDTKTMEKLGSSSSTNGVKKLADAENNLHSSPAPSIDSKESSSINVCGYSSSLKSERSIQNTDTVDTLTETCSSEERQLEEEAERIHDQGFYPSDEGYLPEPEGYLGYAGLHQSGMGLEGIQEGNTLEEEGTTEQADEEETEEQEDEEGVARDDYITGDPGGMPIQPLKLKSSSGSLGQFGIGTGSLGPQQVTQEMGGPMQIKSASQGSMRHFSPHESPRSTQMEYPPAPPTSTEYIRMPHPPPMPPMGKPPKPPQHQPQYQQQQQQQQPQQQQQEVPTPGPLIQGVPFKALPPAALSSSDAIGFIDATKGPWRNRMKGAAQLSMAMRRHQDNAASTIAGAAKNSRMIPEGSVVVEMQDDFDSPSDTGEGHIVKGKKKKKKSAVVVEVQDGSHVRYQENRPSGQETFATAAVPVLGHQQGQEQFLPAPVISAEGRGTDRIIVRWTFERSAEPLYRLMVNVVNVVGRKFYKNVASDLSFECLQEEGDSTSSAVQHCWNVTSGSEIEIGGLIAGTAYTIFVVANYQLVNAKTPTELQAKSAPIRYTTLGPPPSPILRPFASDLYQATLAWETPKCHADVEVTGFRILVDGLQLGELLSRQTHKTTIDNLQPGRTISVSVVAVTSHAVGNSEPSNSVKVTCPHKPPPPQASQQPSYKRGKVVVGWDRARSGMSMPYGEEIAFYRLFVDSKWHGEVKASSAGNRSGYQYYLTDLSSGRAYDVNVRSYAGQVKVDPQSDQLFCISEGDPSNTVPVMCPAPPKSPCLRLEGMHSQGIDITWEMPQQYGDAQISGYQLMKDGKLYGSIMPPDVTSLRIKDASLGDRVQLQILALTDHPVGREHKDATEPSEEDEDSGVGTNTITADQGGYKEMFIGDRYSACRPGPVLVITYTGLVSAPSRVWCEQVNGHSAMIVWEAGKLPRAHYIPPENYQVTWWPKDGDDDQINSQSTKDDHMLITGLKHNTMYNVVVEARKMQNYSDMHEGKQPADDGYGNMFILTGKSEQLMVRTARPPSTPTGLGIVTTTCNSIQVGWDPPLIGGSDITVVRVDVVSMQSCGEKRHKAVEVTPDMMTATLDGLPEKAEYLLTVTFVTEEYFDLLPEGSEVRSKRSLPLDEPPPEDLWLPSGSMIAMTSGSEAPTGIKVKKATIDTLTLTWTPPVVYGSNRLQGTVVRWSDSKDENTTDDMMHHTTINADLNEATIENVCPGVLYKIIVEAIVSVKTNLTGDSKIPEEEKSNRRTTHVPAKPVFIRARAPCEPTKPIITAYTTETIQLYWEKPLLYQCVGKNNSGTPRYVKLSLEGYRLEINGKPHMKLMSSAQSCTLVKCRPGKTYQIVLVALTCTEDAKRERKRKSSTSSKEGGSNEIEYDESASEPIEVTLPAQIDNIIAEMNVNFAAPSMDVEADQYSGDVHVEWSVPGNSENIEEFLITWRCDVDKSLHRKVVPANTRIASIPVNQMKCIYDVYVEPQYTGQFYTEPQKCQVVIPGPPDPVEIWMRSVAKNEFIIEWGEPRLWAVRVQGYQVYLNGKKVGNQLSQSHRKAVIPSKPNRSYKVNLVAISADPNYLDSVMSNTLYITPDNVRYVEAQDDLPQEDDGMPVRVVKVTDTTIQLDWIMFNETQDVVFYRVTWSSVAQPAEREVKLPAGEKSCMLHKCFPGTNHFLRVYAMGKEEQTIDMSKQLTVQTGAPPDTPVVKLRACNFKYIAIEWEKPKTYGTVAITGYKVYINGVVEGVLGADQFSYSFSSGHWCRDYAFQVQAVSASDKLSSKPSDPLVIRWPGIEPPVLRRVPGISSNSVKVTWDQPPSTDGIKVKMYKVVCTDNVSQQPVQVVSPIHPETTEAELHNLKAGSYSVHCEVHLHGTGAMVKSEALQITPTLTPDPPQITVTVIGLDERRQVEKVTTDIINKRDRLINFLTNREVSQSLRINDEDQVIQKVTEDLAHVEDMLDDCLSSLTHYTGHLLAHVSWTCPQSNPDITVSGYRVLVDGKQYGTTLHAGIQNVRIKLGLQQASHQLSMISVSDKPRAMSLQSNVVELLTEPFKPFSFFSFLGANGPKTGGLYAPTLLTERKERRTINQGLLKRHVPPPSATLLEVFEGEFRPLFPPTGPRSPTALLFWAKWNPASWKALGWFVRYARAHCGQYEFIAVACMSNDPNPNDRQELVHIITENGYRDDKCVRHVTSQCASPKTIGSEYIKNHTGETQMLMDGERTRPASGRNGEKTSSDVCKLFGVSGVPMVAVVHPGDYIAWKGRYCAYDYIAYENFLNYVFAQTTGQGASVTDPWDTSIDVDALDGVSKRGMSDSSLLIHRPTNTTRLTAGNTTTQRINNRPASAKNLLFKKTAGKKQKDKLSVNARPYSASSPYSQRLISDDTMAAPPKRRVKSGRKTYGYY